LISVNECFNHLVSQVFWCERGELREDRFEGNLSESEKCWAWKKELIETQYGVSHAYLKSLSQGARKVSLPDFLAMERWMCSLVEEQHRQELQDMIDHLLYQLADRE